MENKFVETCATMTIDQKLAVFGYTETVSDVNRDNIYDQIQEIVVCNRTPKTIYRLTSQKYDVVLYNFKVANPDNKDALICGYFDSYAPKQIPQIGVLRTFIIYSDGISWTYDSTTGCLFSAKMEDLKRTSWVDMNVKFQLYQWKSTGNNFIDKINPYNIDWCAR